MGLPYVFVGYTFQDAKGKTSSTEIKMPASVDIAIAATFARSTAQMIDKIIKGKITDISIGLKIALSSVSSPSLRAAADDDSDVEEGAKFGFLTSAGGSTNLRIPTIDEAIFVAGTEQVDLTSGTDADDFVQRMIAGQTVGIINVSPSDIHEDDIVAVDYAKEAFVGS